MATREDIIAWADATKLFQEGKYNEAINIFQTISGSIGAKIHFNIGMCYGFLNRLNEAIEAMTCAVRADKYFAAAFFQRGVYQILSNAYSKAVQDFSFANDHLRGNAIIDYTQLGLDYRLYLSEVLYNRAICKTKLNDKDGAYNDLLTAQSVKMLSEHDAVDSALTSQKYQTHFSIGKLVYNPPEQKVKNAGKVDYLGSSKIIASSDPSDNIIGFKDAHLRRQAMSNQPPPMIPQSRGLPPGSTVPPPRPNGPPPGTNMNMPPGSTPSKPNMNMPPGSAVPPAGSSTPSKPNMNMPPGSAVPPAGSSAPSRSSAPGPNLNLPPGSSININRPASNPPLGSSRSSPPTGALSAPSTIIPSANRSYPATNAPSAAAAPRPLNGRTPSRNDIEVSNIPVNPAPKMGGGGSPAFQPAATSGSKIKIKCHFKDTRVLLIDSGIRFEELVKRVEEKFDGTRNLKLKYKDDDGDLIMLTDQEDLDVALSTFDPSSNKLEFWCS